MFNKFVPSSLFARFILIILLPTIFAQLIATYIFYNRHWYSVSKNMSLSLANDIIVIYELYNHNIESSRYQQITGNLDIHFNITNIALPIKDEFTSGTELLHSILKKYFASPIKIDFVYNNDAIKITVQKHNKTLTFITNSKRVENSTTYIFIMWMTGTSLIFLLLSIVFTRNQIRPIIKLTRAADLFGRGQNIKLNLEGASEIRKAALAFLTMKERIERQISNRTEMLAGVSHDLRTPLTRMKLQLALSKDQETKAMLEDVQDMERMINSYLDFARGDIKENTKTVLIDKFIIQILKLYSKEDIIIKNLPHVKITIKTDAIKRCIYNLLENSLKFANKILINSYKINKELYLEIHDDGPGIAIEKREDVFKPFYRIEDSRNKNTGGVGLGLAITKDIISNHGGTVSLDSSEILQGLKVTIILPL